MKTIEKSGAWMLRNLPKRLPLVAACLAVAALFIQIGIWRGRSLERQDIIFEMLGLELEAEIQVLTREVEIAEIIQCESGGRHDGVWGDGGRSYGIAQFQERTFDWLGEKAGMRDPNWKSREDQITLLRWAVANGYGYLWTCYGEGA